MILEYPITKVRECLELDTNSLVHCLREAKSVLKANSAHFAIELSAARAELNVCFKEKQVRKPKESVNAECTCEHTEDETLYVAYTGDDGRRYMDVERAKPACQCSNCTRKITKGDEKP